MKRDMDLVREILLKIEEEHMYTTITNLKIDGYDMVTVAYHCKIMYEAGLISNYGSSPGNNTIYMFQVGGLTWEGNDYLDKIRDNSIWKKTKDTIASKGLPLIFDTIKTVSTAIVTSIAEGVTDSFLKNGGQV